MRRDHRDGVAPAATVRHGAHRRCGRDSLALRRIGIWSLAVTALLLTLWQAGPRAYAVLAHHGRRTAGAAAELERVGFRSLPAWLSGPLLLAVMSDLEPRLRGRADLLDDRAAGRIRRGLLASPWVGTASLDRVFPDRLSAGLELRRPTLALVDDAGAVLGLVDGNGVWLPPVEGTGLPVGHALAPSRANLGELHPDPVVRAAARVAAEWRDEIAPAVDGVPALVEVDARNVGYRFVGDRRWSEVRVGLRRGDGAIVYLSYGHPPGVDAPRVPAATKVRILKAILAEYPQLAGLHGGDLRFANRWRHWLVPRPDPARLR